MEFCLLGPLEARRNSEPVPLRGAKQRALLARLLVDAPAVVSTDTLVDDLWGEQPPDGALRTVQVVVSRLRKVLGPEALVTQAPGYLVVGDVDVGRFRQLRCESARAAGGGPPRGRCRPTGGGACTVAWASARGVRIRGVCRFAHRAAGGGAARGARGSDRARAGAGPPCAAGRGAGGALRRTATPRAAARVPDARPLPLRPPERGPPGVRGAAPEARRGARPRPGRVDPGARARDPATRRDARRRGKQAPTPPAGNGHLPLHRHRRVNPAAARGLSLCSPPSSSIGTCCARRSQRTPVWRSTHRATPFSSRSQPH